MEAVSVYVVVVLGETTTEEPFTVPTPGLMETDGAGLPDTDQERVDELPLAIVEGEAVNEEMCGEPGETAPGVPKFCEASSSTRTHSFESGDVKVWVPVVAKVPMLVAAPVTGLYHHACALVPETFVILTVSVAGAPLLPGIYAITVAPELCRSAGQYVS